MQAAGAVATCEGSEKKHSIDVSTKLGILRGADDDTIGASAFLFADPEILCAVNI